MCDREGGQNSLEIRTIPVQQAVGAVLAHDVTEIRKGEFKGPAFRKGHIIRKEDVCHLQRLGKENLFVLSLGPDDMHEDEAAVAITRALMGEGVAIKGEPREGKITVVAARDGLLKIDVNALRAFNMVGDVMCATLHTNTVVKKGQEVAGTRAIPLVVTKAVVDRAVKTAQQGSGVLEVKEIRKPRAGVVITGNEVFHGRIQDEFAPIISKKIEEYGGEVVGTYYAPDDEQFIADRLRELLDAGADLLITTGGMSVDPDDVTRFAIKSLGATDITYGSAVLPGAMVLVACLERRDERSATSDDTHSSRVPRPSSRVPILGIPACGMYHKTTVFDLVLPRVLAGERIGREELAELGHGGLCLHCPECRYPVCPFGK
ncbi:MAG: molybdopterin-binding protein [Nitrospirae bacterium]|nr:molybdopterin-binding protein [Nitrospirota bacterium]NTW66882.1 molybdopterin-binding protein [Nitrospirota bacterium]